MPETFLQDHFSKQVQIRIKYLIFVANLKCQITSFIVRINGVIKWSPLCKSTEIYYAIESFFLKLRNCGRCMKYTFCLSSHSFRVRRMWDQLPVLPFPWLVALSNTLNRSEPQSPFLYNGDADIYLFELYRLNEVSV